MLNDQPRIAGLWDDLNPSAGVIVSFSQTSRTFTVYWDDVPEFPAAGRNTISITLKRSSNHVDDEYGDLTATDGLAGISCGGAVTSRFEAPTDLSSYYPDRVNMQPQPAQYEVFASGTNDLASSTVLYNGSQEYNDTWAGKNGSLRKARSIKLPFDSISVQRYTEIEPTGGDIDFFRFQGTGGTILVAEILTGGLDTLLGLFDAGGNLIAVDDDGGAGLLSRVAAPLPANGTYYLGVTTFPDFGFTGAGGREPTGKCSFG
jgi:hypothetical protein